MVEIIPAILAKDEAEFRAKVERVRGLGLPLHIDVMDGTFTEQSTWAPVDRMKEILGDIPFDAHLMVSSPEHAVPVWVAAGARRAYFHAETTYRDMLICRATADHCDDIGIALNPETPVSRVTAEVDKIRNVMVMGVKPGRSGQALEDLTAEKVAALRAVGPDLRIQVDGGVKAENARALAEAGADSLVLGSALTDQPDPAAALLALRRAIEE